MALASYLPKSWTARIVAGVSIVLTLALAGAVGWKLWLAEQPAPGPAAGQRIGGPFSLTDTKGETVTAADLHGGYALVYFGYTHCPDVCPATLNAMSQALDYVADKAPAKAERVTPVFVTVDPARDDAARMRDYVANFHPDFVGLTGSPAEVKRAAQAYKVSYSKVAPEAMDGTEHAGRDHGGYLMRHSSYVFLMGPEGRHLDHVSHNAGATRIAEMIQRQVAG